MPLLTIIIILVVAGLLHLSGKSEIYVNFYGNNVILQPIFFLLL